MVQLLKPYTGFRITHLTPQLALVVRSRSSHLSTSSMGNAASGPSKEAVVAAAKAKGSYMPPLGPPNPVSLPAALISASGRPPTGA